MHFIFFPQNAPFYFFKDRPLSSRASVVLPPPLPGRGALGAAASRPLTHPPLPPASARAPSAPPAPPGRGPGRKGRDRPPRGTGGLCGAGTAARRHRPTPRPASPGPAAAPGAGGREPRRHVAARSGGKAGLGRGGARGMAGRGRCPRRPTAPAGPPVPRGPAERRVPPWGGGGCRGAARAGPGDGGR